MTFIEQINACSNSVDLAGWRYDLALAGIEPDIETERQYDLRLQELRRMEIERGKRQRATE